MQLTFTATCLFGLEGIVADELRRMGAENVRAENGRVLFDGDFTTMTRANLRLRSAERVLVVMGQFEAATFAQLFDGVRALPFEDFIGPKDKFPVKGWSLDSALFSVPDCQSIVKKAVVERLKGKYGISWFEETGSMFQIQFSLHKNHATILLDTSGPGLHKRGYRAEANEAPIKETLAAAMADIARVKHFSTLVDPFCGSGTILIEGAMKAFKIAPGLKRRFAFEYWNVFDKAISRQQRELAISEIITQTDEFACYGYDIDPAAVELTLSNAAKAGVGRHIKASVAPIDHYRQTFEKSIVICNPPYGERMLEIDAARALYREMGKRFLPKADYSYYVISPDETFEAQFGRRADKKRKLYNGMIKCDLYMYFK